MIKKSKKNENNFEDIKNTEAEQIEEMSKDENIENDIKDEIIDDEKDNISVEELKEKLIKAENISKEYLDKLQRNMAEFDNFRKRTIKEKASMYDDGAIETIKKLLPIVDNFERAVEAANDDDKQNSFYKGIEMILKQFKEILYSIGVEEINVIGEQFNPSIHNAVMHIDNEDYGENEVIEQLQKGYKYKEKVIRPSMVKVAN